MLSCKLPIAAGSNVSWRGLGGLSQALVLAYNATSHSQPLIVILPNLLTLQHMQEELEFFCPKNEPDFKIISFPDSETLPYDYFSPHPDLTSKRLLALQQIPRIKHGIILISITTLLHLLPPRDFIEKNSLVIKVGDTLNLEQFRLNLQDSGYRLVTQVMEHGEYALRGSIIDIFPMGSNLPFRIDLFGDEIDSLRSFDVENQLSQTQFPNIQLLPAHEFPLTETAIALFRNKWRENFSGDPTNIPLYQNISNGQSAPGIEYYLPLFFNNLSSFFDYIPQNSTIVDSENLLNSAEKFWHEIDKRYQSLSCDKNRPLLKPQKLFISADELKNKLNKFPLITFSSGNTPIQTNNSEVVNFNTFNAPILDKLSIDFFQQPQSRFLLISASLGRQQQLLKQLRDINIYPTLCSSWNEFLASEQQICITIAPLDRGLKLVTDAKTNIFILTESELFGKKILLKRRSNKGKSHDLENIIRNLTELTIGAPVVHIEHGVGRYLGLKNLQIKDNANEFLVLEYANQTKLYVPVTSLHLISRYTGADADHAPINYLGTNKWQKTKSKVKKQIRDVAAQLLGIYAKRAAQVGHRFSEPGEDYDKFVETFPFEETDDQNRAIDAVIHDMTQTMPMDRIICGDVGFGKTEVAMRAAFIAASQGKQVALLAPTTLLVEQHYQNFCDRFAEFPLQIGILSRFGKAQDQKQLIEKIAAGKIDIVIGTHKLLQPTIKFKNLGLLVVDEEHRFGVKHKERIKALAPNIDILTLTATPIPRTLNMALSGLRDFSIIATPPHGRLSIKTFIHQRLKHLIREAVMREILRGGQVYFLHNDIASIARIANELKELVPEANISIAHGKMPEKELEKIMRDFYKRRINVLVCTTIIESGIDIASANTIIIDRADHFGLAELHQLRGRVGRSNHQAYAYLLIPEQNSLTENAKKRLQAIAAMEDLGIGFTLATRDLEIRGAGELLGEKQSGVMHEVGFDMYMETLEKAVHALKNGQEFSIEEEKDSNLIEIELNLPALIPDNYIADVNNRLIMYKRIANAKDSNELDQIQIELIDRFGLLPLETKTLFAITELKLKASLLGVTKISANTKQGIIEFIGQPNIDAGKIIALLKNHPNYYQLKNGNKLSFQWPETATTAEAKITFIANLFNSIV